MNFQALQDNIVLRPIMAGNESAGGILLPNKGDFENGAVVISIGPDVKDIAVGDIVVRPEPCRYDIDDADTGEILLFCAEVDVLAKILPEVDRSLEADVRYKCEDCVHCPDSPYEVCKDGVVCNMGIGDDGVKPSKWVQREANDALDQAEETEKTEEVADPEGGKVHVDRIPESRLDHLLPVHPVEGLPKDDGN